MGRTKFGYSKNRGLAMRDSLKKKLSNLDLVIFDLDGTLIDSNGAHNCLDIELVRSLGDNQSSNEILQE